MGRRGRADRHPFPPNGCFKEGGLIPKRAARHKTKRPVFDQGRCRCLLAAGVGYTRAAAVPRRLHAAATVIRFAASGRRATTRRPSPRPSQALQRVSALATIRILLRAAVQRRPVGPHSLRRRLASDKRIQLPCGIGRNSSTSRPCIVISRPSVAGVKCSRWRGSSSGHQSTPNRERCGGEVRHHGDETAARSARPRRRSDDLVRAMDVFQRGAHDHYVEAPVGDFRVRQRAGQRAQAVAPRDLFQRSRVEVHGGDGPAAIARCAWRTSRSRSRSRGDGPRRGREWPSANRGRGAARASPAASGADPPTPPSPTRGRREGRAADRRTLGAYEPLQPVDERGRLTLRCLIGMVIIRIDMADGGAVGSRIEIGHVAAPALRHVIDFAGRFPGAVSNGRSSVAPHSGHGVSSQTTPPAATPCAAIMAVPPPQGVSVEGWDHIDEGGGAQGQDLARAKRDQGASNPTAALLVPAGKLAVVPIRGRRLTGDAAMTQEERCELALQTKEPERALRALALDLAKEGRRKAEIYTLSEGFASKQGRGPLRRRWAFNGSMARQRPPAKRTTRQRRWRDDVLAGSRVGAARQPAKPRAARTAEKQ